MWALIILGELCSIILSFEGLPEKCSENSLLRGDIAYVISYPYVLEYGTERRVAHLALMCVLLIMRYIAVKF